MSSSVIGPDFVVLDTLNLPSKYFSNIGGNMYKKQMFSVMFNFSHPRPQLPQ